MLESRDLTKKFGAKTAVDAVSIVMEPGHVYAMLGPNGSGKTTWMKMAADAASRYLRDLDNLGLTRRDAIRLLNEKEETEDA